MNSAQRQYQERKQTVKRFAIHGRVIFFLFTVLPQRYKWAKIYGIRWFWDENLRIRTKNRIAKKRKRVHNRSGKLLLVIQRDGKFCRNCGSQDNLTLDHIIPIADGGGNAYTNFQVLCYSCNNKKSVLNKLEHQIRAGRNLEFAKKQNTLH